MSRAAMNQSLLEEEDLAIQDTLAMDTEQRLDLLVSLIVDKIIEDKNSGELLFKKLGEGSCD